MGIEEGKTAPAFTLPDANGNQVTLKDFRGKNIILYFYPKDNTSGCTKEAEGFRDLNEEFLKRDVIILGVSPDSESSHRKFIEKNALPFSLLSDPDKKVMTAYGAFGEKKMYGRLVQGVIRSTVWIDPNGKVKKRWPRVAKAADHPQKVLEEIGASHG
jgi:thioredoxin-dependent peroxiredoxin